VTDAKRAARALRWTVGEMERRYKLLAGTGARNIDGFNTKLAGANPPTDPEGGTLEPLPYIVVLVDELADLMLTAPLDIEEPIARLPRWRAPSASTWCSRRSARRSTSDRRDQGQLPVAHRVPGGI
jgi:S-DNA-T family DNA segregation ATPase FtsK/SpoIIIE